MRHILLPFLLTAAATAQAQVAVPVRPVQSSSLEPGKALTIEVMVDGKAGPVTGLTQKNFTLRDNKTVQPITSFRPVHGITEVILLIDAVNADERLISQERQRIDDFLTTDGGQLAFPTTLAILQDKGVEIQNAPTRDGNALKASLEKTDIGLRAINRASGIYGADDRASISLNALRSLLTREASKPGRKLILFVSPGWPLLSGPGIDLDSRQQNQIFGDVMDLYDLFRSSQTTLYSVDPIGAGESPGREDYYEAFLSGVDGARKTDLGDLALQVLAVHSGGRVLNGNNDTAALLREAVRDSSESYELTYTLPAGEQDPKHPTPYHHIEVKVENSGSKPRTIDGYYTRP